MKLCIFEDEHFQNFLPLAWLRPVYSLKCGITSLSEKISAAFHDMEVSYLCRDYLESILKSESGAVVNECSGGRYLLINGRVVSPDNLREQIDHDDDGCVYLAEDGSPAAAVISEKSADKMIKKGREPETLTKLLTGLRAKNADVEMVSYPWDLTDKTKVKLTGDFQRIYARLKNKIPDCDGCHFVNKNNVYISPSAILKPGIVIDASDGPVCIDEQVVIQANSVIEGPAYIGKGSLIKAGSRIFGGTSIGAVSKIGGEVANSVIHGYSNKQHDGFLGNSYLCEWVNLGAGTNNSDLKNNYNNVRFDLNGRTVDSGMKSAGLYMGDHSKSGIGTMFNTGTVAGIHCNIFGSGYQTKHIPSFSWGGADDFQEYDLDKALETASIVMARRNVELSPEYLRLNSLIFKLTLNERSSFSNHYQVT